MLVGRGRDRGGREGGGSRDQGDQSFISIAATQCVEDLGFVLWRFYVPYTFSQIGLLFYQTSNMK